MSENYLETVISFLTKKHLSEVQKEELSTLYAKLYKLVHKLDCLIDKYMEFVKHYQRHILSELVQNEYPIDNSQYFNDEYNILVLENYLKSTPFEKTHSNFDELNHTYDEVKNNIEYLQKEYVIVCKFIHMLKNT